MTGKDDKEKRRQAPLFAPLKGRLTLYVVLLVIAVIIMAMVRDCSTPSPFSTTRISNSGPDTLDVAIEYGPMTLYRYHDTLGGFGYDLVRDMMARADRPLKFHPVTSARMGLQLLTDGTVDMVIAETPRTADSDSLVAYTEPVYLDRQVLVQRRDSAGEVRVKSALDLAGRQVTVAAGSPMYYRLRNLSDEIGDTIIIVPDSIYGAEQLVIMTALGEIEFAVVNNRVAQKIKPDYPQLDVSTDISFTQFQSWIMRSADSTIQEIDSIIRAYRLTPAYKEVQHRYGM